jgi:transposase InsO family protein
MDLITQLPVSNGYDAILTIVDHGCTRAAIFLPCKTTVTGQEIAKLYYDNIYRWFGLPNKVISNRDPQFTSLFAKALAQQLGIKQNMSSAFHPQTDGLSERTNQWVEQYLRLTINSTQTDWSDWLGIATMVHNNHKNATINIAPSEALLSYMPRLHPVDPPPSLNQHTEDRKQTVLKRRAQAIEAINHTAYRTPPPQLQVNQEVWLEAKNLQLPFQTPKLAPK